MLSREKSNFVFNTFMLMMMATAGLAVAATIAQAADISLQPVYDSINVFLEELLKGLAVAIASGILALVTMGFRAVKIVPDAYRTYVEANARNALNTALQNGVNVAMQKVRAMEGAHQTVHVNGAIQSIAVEYALKHAPGAIAHFGLDPHDLAVKALAYLPTFPTETDVAAAAPRPAPVEVGKLEDIKQ